MARKTTPVIERLLSKVQKSEDGCWNFTGTKIASGYGKIAVTRGRPAFAHRIAYKHLVGEIPEGLYVLHRCDNPSCVNPDHLFVGTQKDNWLDARAKGRNYASPQVTPNV